MNLKDLEYLVALAEEFQLILEGKDNAHLLTKQLNDALLEFARLGRGVVVCIDEAQALPRESLETLRLLSNLETEKIEDRLCFPIDCKECFGRVLPTRVSRYGPTSPSGTSQLNIF